MPVLARIPQPSRSRRLHANGRHEDPAFLEAFEFLRLNLQLMGPKGRNVVLAVTSPTAGNGKTTVVAWLSRALALSGAEVLAVDLDRRKPDLHNYLNAYGEPENGVFRSERNHDGDAPAAAERPSRRVYTAEDIRAGLTELAQCGGNARAAARSRRSSTAMSSPSPPCAGGSACTHRSTPRSASGPTRRRPPSPPSRAGGRPWPMSSPSPRGTRTCGW